MLWFLLLLVYLFSVVVRPPQIKQHEFRENFRKDAPFLFNSENVYSRLDRVSNRDDYGQIWALSDELWERWKTLFFIPHSSLSPGEAGLQHITSGLRRWRLSPFPSFVRKPVELVTDTW